jgi:hypothetical protein
MITEINSFNKKMTSPEFINMTSGDKLLAVVKIVNYINSIHNRQEFSVTDFIHILDNLGCDIIRVT